MPVSQALCLQRLRLRPSTNGEAARDTTENPEGVQKDEEKRSVTCRDICNPGPWRESLYDRQYRNKSRVQDRGQDSHRSTMQLRARISFSCNPPTEYEAERKKSNSFCPFNES